MQAEAEKVEVEEAAAVAARAAAIEQEAAGADQTQSETRWLRLDAIRVRGMAGKDEQGRGKRDTE